MPENLVVYRCENISRFICHCCWMPCPAKQSVSFPSFALRCSSTLINFSLPGPSALSSNRLGHALTKEVPQHYPGFLISVSVFPYCIQTPRCYCNDIPTVLCRDEQLHRRAVTVVRLVQRKGYRVKPMMTLPAISTDVSKREKEQISRTI